MTAFLLTPRGGDINRSRQIEVLLCRVLHTWIPLIVKDLSKGIEQTPRVEVQQPLTGWKATLVTDDKGAQGAMHRDAYRCGSVSTLNPKGIQLKTKAFLLYERHVQNELLGASWALSGCLQRLLFNTRHGYLGTLFLTGAILEVGKTIAVIQYHWQNTTVQNTYCVVMKQPNLNQLPGS